MNSTFIFRMLAELFTMASQAMRVARGDEELALKLIRDRRADIQALEDANDERAREAILGAKEKS